jgi:hypothetical protein
MSKLDLPDGEVLRGLRARRKELNRELVYLDSKIKIMAHEQRGQKKKKTSGISFTVPRYISRL